MDQKENKQEYQQSVRRNLNLKFGDVIFLKSYFQLSKGVVAGDGIASNKLECVKYLNLNKDVNLEIETARSVKSKVGNLIFQKCLFRIEPAKKYIQQEKSKVNQEDGAAKIDPEFQTKIDDEIKENERLTNLMVGTNVSYGQDIQLIHLYSKCVLTLNYQVLAKQNCCRELSLEEFPNTYSNFKILSVNKAKQAGEPVLYGDQIIIGNSYQNSWQLGIQKPLNIQNSLQDLNDGLEVNATENPQPLKLCYYMDHKVDQESRNPLSRGRFLQSGDIIRIKNRALGGFLSIKRENFITSKLKERIVQFKDADTKGNKPHVQHYFDIADLKKQSTINSLYKLYVDTNESNTNSLNNLWQVQLRDGLKQDKCTYEKDYLLKHVSTGCFLQIQQDKLILTYNGTDKDCIFQLKSKKGGREFISYNESIKIINTNQVIVCKKSGIQTQNKNEKTDIQQSMFLFKPVNESLALVANRISSLQTYLLQFYLYLQDWGMIVDKKGSPILEYDYFKSFNNQKTLFDEIQQLFQSLENLTLFLNNDNEPQSSEEQQQNQKAVQENDIINLLIAILKLVQFMIYGQSKEQNPNQPKEISIPDKSPQKIAKLKLDPVGDKQKNCIKEIYKILQLCVQSSSSTSDFIFQLKIFHQPVLLFLLQQLKFYRKEVSDLLKETVRYTEMNDDSTSGNLEKWIQELKDVTDENIEDQTLFIELLSLMMIDPFENPNQLCQDQCRKLLFKKINKDKSQSLISFGLLDQKNSQVKIPYVQFNYNQGNEDVKFQLYNQMFCTLYHSYLVSSVHTQIPLNRVSINFFTTNTLKNYHIDQAQDYEKVYQTFLKYEQYVLAVLNLYSSLCKGRNQKSIEMLRDECKIDGQFLYCCFKFLHSNQHQLRFERSIMNLYINLQLDIDPLTPISKFQNNSFVYEEVRNFDSQKNCSGLLFYEQSISSEMKERFQSKQDDKSQIQLDYQILKKYASTVLNQVNEGDVANRNPLKEYINMFREEQLPQIFTLEDVKITQKIKEINYAVNAQYQLEYFLSLLNIIKISVDLGYNDLETNTYILDTLPNILIVMIIQQSEEAKLFQFNTAMDYQANQEKLKQNIENNDIFKKYYKQPDLQTQQGEFLIFNQKKWMLELLIWTTCMANDDLLCMKIYLEAIKILKTLIKLKKHLCVVDYLRDQINKNESRIDKVQLAPSVSSRADKRSNTSRQGSFQNTGVLQKIDVYQEQGKLDMKKILFECLYTAKGRNQLIYELMDTLVLIFKFPTQLCEEIQKVELIDNSVELDYFATANGNSKDQDWLSPKEAQLTIRRLIKLYKLPENEGVPLDLKQTKKLIQLGEFQDKNQQKNITMQKLQSYLNAILLKFETVKQEDQKAFQNIIRNAGIHKVFIELVNNVGKLISDKEIVLLFRKVIQFYTLFSVDNYTNIQELQQYIGKLLQVATLEQEQSTDLFYHPLNVVKLIIQLLQQAKGDLKIQIEQIFSLISQCYRQIKTKLFKRIRSTKQEDVFKKEFDEEEEFDAAKNIILINAIKQYIKILKSLTQTFTKPADPLQANKHQILTYVLKSSTLKGLIEPLNFYQNIIIPDQEQFEEDNEKVIKFHQLKLHAAMISLITDCCKFDRLAIQEMQRVLSFEQLKTILLNVQGAYIVKRSYLMCLFELYINRVRDGNQFNETIDADEIRDVLSRIIIPELDQKQIMKYLEGLARLRLDEQGYKVESKQLRESIIIQKQQQAQREIQQFEQTENQLILRDASEFWRYIRKNAIIHFLVFTYDEKKDLIDKDTKSEESTLSDEFAIIKQSVQKIKSIFNKLERDYRMKKEDLDLDIYRDLITSLEEIIPQRKITKFGQNYRINNSGNELNVHTSNTLKDDQGVDKKIQDQGDNVQRLDIVYQRNVKIFLIRYNATIQNVLEYFTLKYNKAPLYSIINVFRRNDKVYLSAQDITNLKENEVDKIRKQQTINSNKLNENDDIYFKQALIELFGKKQNPQNEETLRIEQMEKKKNDQILQEAIQNFPKEVSNQIKQQVTALEKNYAIHQKSKAENLEEINKNLKEDQTEEIRLNSEHEEDLEPDKSIDTNLSEDKQILILILNLEMESCEEQLRILNFDNLDVFITRCTNIFIGQEVYLIKISRILLEKFKPIKDEIEQLDNRKEKEDEEEKQKIDNIQEKLEKFKKMQTDVCIKSQLDQTAMQQLSTQEGKQYLQYEVVSLLVTLLEFGNQEVQQQIFEAFKSNYRLKNLFIQFLRKLFAQDIQGKKGIKTQHSKTLKNEQIKLGIKVLRLLQLLCENVNLDFQKFLTVQNENDQYSSNVNIIAETQNYLAEVIDDKTIDDSLKHELIRQGIETLVEFTTGVDQNRIEICKNQRFFQLIQRMFPQDMIANNNKNYFHKNYNPAEKKLNREKYNNFQLLLSYVKLIQTLVQGNPQKKQLQFVYQIFNVDQFIIVAEKIYNQRIVGKQNKIELDLICNNNHNNCNEFYCSEDYKTDEDQILLLLGFSIFIICYQLTDGLEGDEYPQLFPFKFDGKDEELEQNIKKLVQQPAADDSPAKQKYQELGNQVAPEDAYEEVNDQFTQNRTFGIDAEILNSQKYIEQKREKTRKSAYFKFYRSYIGRVELQNSNDQLEKVYFQIPFVKKFITPNIKNHIIYGSNRDTDEDRIQSLILNHQFYLKQMEHNQSIQERPFVRFGANYWRLLKDISFCLCFVIVLLLLFMHDTVINSKIGSTQETQDEGVDKIDSDFERFVSYLNNIITIIQLVLNLIIIIFCAIERYPISITYRQGETNAFKIVSLKKEAGFEIPRLNQIYHSILGSIENLFEPKFVQDNWVKKMILILFLDFDNFYNLCIFGLTVYAFFNPYVYVILLLDIIKRSEDLQNIIKSITQNGQNLIIFSFLGGIGLTIYGVLCYNYFNVGLGFGNNDSFILSVTTVINKGLRNGGGIGDVLDDYYSQDENKIDPTKDANTYWGYYFLTFSFYIIFNILFVNIIFGIILDTFGQLRDERQELIKEIEEKCFVCSLERNQIDSKGKTGWYQHIYLEHNVYHMLFYIIYVKKKNTNDCNRLEQHVKKCIEEEPSPSTDFFPKNAIQMLEDQD